MIFIFAEKQNVLRNNKHKYFNDNVSNIIMYKTEEKWSTEHQQKVFSDYDYKIKIVIQEGNFVVNMINPLDGTETSLYNSSHFDQ